MHPISMSHMLAAESDLSVGAHIRAEDELITTHDNPLAGHERLTIVDGGKSLVNKSLQLRPLVSLLRCSRHLADDLLKGNKHEKHFVETFREWVRWPRSRRAAIERALQLLPSANRLTRIPKEQLCAALLPDGVCTHGNTTNNAAEVLNGMLLPLRHQNSLFTSLMSAVNFLRKRQTALQEHVMQVKRGPLLRVVSAGTCWPDNAAVPSVMAEVSKLRSQCSALGNVMEKPGSPGVYLVPSNTTSSMTDALGVGYVWEVDISAMRSKDFDRACRHVSLVVRDEMMLSHVNDI